MSAAANKLPGIVVVALLLPGPTPAENITAASESGCESTQTPRRRPGRPAPEPVDCAEKGLRPANWGALPGRTAVPDRWRLVTALGYPERWWDPYNGNNVLKGDRPAFAEDWFFSLALVSDSTLELRKVPTPVAIATSPGAGALDVFGKPGQLLMTENLLAEFVLYQGETVFKPPDYEFRFIPVFSLSRVEVDEAGFLKVDSSAPLVRGEGFVGIQGLFIDKHLRNVSERYDFDSIRIGIQPITVDFRGLLFQDSPAGVRLFGTRNNNLWQYNLGWFRRIEKDTNSGLNDITENDLSDALRDDDVFLFNLYRQDFPVPGFTSSVAIVHNRNTEGGTRFVDDNGFLTRPAALGVQQGRNYDVTYLGYSGDGHFGRWNLSVSAYLALGDESAAVFSGRSSDIRAAFAAGELSRDFDWIRTRATAVYGTGDDDPYDDRSTGFDAIFENPLLAGADTSFWIRQSFPLIAGGRVALSGQNGLLNSLRPNKGQGQSNFTNPGIVLLGLGVDLDVTPKLRVSLNANQLWFDDTAVLEAARNQGGIGKAIGQDLSAAVFYRPFTSQNVIIRVAAATLLPGTGYRDLFGDEMPYSLFANLVLAY